MTLGVLLVMEIREDEWYAVIMLAITDFGGLLLRVPTCRITDSVTVFRGVTYLYWYYSCNHMV